MKTKQRKVTAVFFEFALIGTTASGKTALAIELAKKLNGVVLSLDSLCVYREINIASAKPSEQEQDGVKHFGLNLVSVDEPFCAGDFAKQYIKAHEFAINAKCPLIITGGTGFYLRALTYGLSPRIPALPYTLSNAQIWTIASEKDPEFCAKFSENDTFRLQKWLEIYEYSNHAKPSKWLSENTCEPVIKDIKIFELVWDRAILRNRIKERTKAMIENGLLSEARKLFSKYDSNLKPLRSVGLKECALYLENNSNLNENLSELDNEGSALNELFELISTHTAQLAKRQRTFNRSQFPSRTELGANEAKEKILKWINSNLG